MGYYDYGYNGYNSMGLDAATAGAVEFMLVFLVVFYLIMIAACIACYVLQAVGMYSIAKRRGIHHAWLAWIPVGNLWLLGSISDQYQYLAKERVRNRRGLLLGLSIALYAVMILMYVGIIFAAIGMRGALLAITVLCLLAYFVLAIVATVFQYIAMYDLYASSDPGNAVLYTVLSILFSISMPFFVFACRKKDLGMPPRKQTVQEVPFVEASADTTEE